MQDKEDNRKDHKLNTEETGTGTPDRNAPETGTPGGLFDAYITKIKAITVPKTDEENKPDAIAQADRVIEQARARREKLQKEQEEADAIAQTDQDLEEQRRRGSGTAALPKDIMTGPGEAADPEGAPEPEDEGSGGRSEGTEGTKRNEVPHGRHRSGKLVRALLAVLLVALTVATIYLIRKYTPTNRRMSYQEYFGDMAKDEAAIVLQDENISERALIQGGALYLPYDLVRDKLNERFYWDESRAEMLFTTATQTYEIPVNSSSYSIIDGALASDPTSEASYDRTVVLRRDDGSLFMDADFVAQYTDIRYTLEKDTSHVWLEYRWGKRTTASARKDAAVRYQGGIKSPILTDLNKGDSVYVLEQLDSWTKVLTDNGFIGYVSSSRLNAPKKISVKTLFQAQKYPSVTADKKISVAWQIISSREGNKTLDDTLANVSNLDVISPTWFKLSTNDGDVDSIGTKAYVKNAHKKNLKVWGLIDDFSSEMDTSTVLASTDARRNCIAQLMTYASNYGLDGINLDFEYMDEADALAYTQFVRELSIACRRAGVVLSVDLVTPFDFNSYLNRREVATVADYLINMGYDEHYAGSEAGSVASLSFEENGIKSLIDMGISPSKIITAVPFYTRIWYTSYGDDGKKYVNSEELSMGSVQGTITNWKVTPVWDAQTCQNYAEWKTDDGVLCQIWIEDAESLERKLLLVPKYDLAGTAAWALGFQDDALWTTVGDSLNLSKDDALKKEEEAIAREAQLTQRSAETEGEAQTEA